MPLPKYSLRATRPPIHRYVAPTQAVAHMSWTLLSKQRTVTGRHDYTCSFLFVGPTHHIIHKPTTPTHSIKRPTRQRYAHNLSAELSFTPLNPTAAGCLASALTRLSVFPNPHPPTRSPRFRPAPSSSIGAAPEAPLKQSDCFFSSKFHLNWSKSGLSFFVTGGWNRVSGAGFLKPLARVSFAFMPGAGAVYFLVGSALGFFAMLHASESEVGGEWASAAHWVALSRSVSAHHLFVAMSLLFLVSRIWRLGKRCDAVEELVGNADATVQALRVRGVICSVCGTKIRAPKKSSLGPTVELVRSDGCSDKPVARSLASEMEQEADTEDEDNASEVNGAEKGNVDWLRRRLVRERRLKEAALEELEKERRAAASAADEAMAKIACLRNENALVEREVRQFREMAQQKQMYDRQVIESLQWVINRFGMQCGELELSSDRAVSETSEDDRDKQL